MHALLSSDGSEKQHEMCRMTDSSAHFLHFLTADGVFKLLILLDIQYMLFFFTEAYFLIQYFEIVFEY